MTCKVRSFCCLSIITTANTCFTATYSLDEEEDDDEKEDLEAKSKMVEQIAEAKTRKGSKSSISPVHSDADAVRRSFFKPRSTEQAQVRALI